MIRRRSLASFLLLLTVCIATAQKDRGDSSITIPAGTQIKVDVSEENPPRNIARTYQGKVIAPVQVGGTVAIPALSKVTIQVSIGPPSGELRELTQVTLDGGSYDLHTDRVPMPGGSISEMVFTLVKGLTVKR